MQIISFIYYLIATYLIALPLRILIGVPLVLACGLFTIILGEERDSFFYNTSTESFAWSSFWLRYKLLSNTEGRKYIYNACKLLGTNEDGKYRSSAKKVIDHYRKHYKNG